jgi:hypothetical protein
MSRTRQPVMSPAARKRLRTIALRKAVERAAAYADEKLREALEQGWIDATDLPADVRQRIGVLEGHITGNEVVLDDPPVPPRKSS